MSGISDKMAAFAVERVAYISKLKNPSEQQSLFAELWRKRESGAELTAAETRAVKTLLAAEKAAEKSAAASRAARRILNAEKEEARKRETRQKILLGALCMKVINEHRAFSANGWADWKRELDGFLTKNADRALFDLPPLAEQPDPAESDGLF